MASKRLLKRFKIGENVVSGPFEPILLVRPRKTTPEDRDPGAR